MVIPPSGEQWEIRRGEQLATIVEVGGGVRRYEVAGRPVLDPYPLEAMCDGAHGTPLIPWPNRLGDGRYRFDDVDYQLPLTEPERHNAIHGLLRWRSWRPVELTAARVVMGIRLYPLPGYPFCLDVRVTYGLDDDGLTVATTTTNLGDQPCPYGCGQHPYLSAGGGLIDDCVLHLDADTRILTDEQRQLPSGTEAVDDSPYDFRAGERLGDLRLDFPFTDLRRDRQGRAWARLSAPDGSRGELWADESYPIIQLYTGDTLEPPRRRLGVGAEPMSCPPNAFQSGDRLLRLDPGQSVTTTWGARLARGDVPAP